MAHHIYTTDTFVIRSSVSGEADRFFTLFTRELGLVRATARGVRLLRSKLRYSLQDFSRGRVSLVRGKEVWRITNARIEDSLFTHYRENKEALTVIAHIFSLIERLMGGEEKNERLFLIITEALSFLGSRALTSDELKLFEIIVVLRMLDDLGYLGNIPELSPFIAENWSPDLIEALVPHKARALREINTSLRETHL